MASAIQRKSERELTTIRHIKHTIISRFQLINYEKMHAIHCNLSTTIDRYNLSTYDPLHIQTFQNNTFVLIGVNYE